MEYMVADNDDDSDVQLVAQTLRVLPNLSSLTFQTGTLQAALFEAILDVQSLVSLQLIYGELALPEGAPRPAVKLALQHLALIDFPIPCNALTLLMRSDKLSSLTVDSNSTAHALDLLSDDTLDPLLARPRPIQKISAQPYKESAMQLNKVLNQYRDIEELGLVQPTDCGDPFQCSDLNLEAGALPNLARFRGPSSLAPAIVAGRPVDAVCLDMHSGPDGVSVRPRHISMKGQREADRLAAVHSLRTSVRHIRSVEYTVQNLDKHTLDEVPLGIEELRLTSLKDDRTKVCRSLLSSGVPIESHRSSP